MRTRDSQSLETVGTDKLRQMAVPMGRSLLDRAHLVQVDLETTARQLESRLAASKATSDDTYTLGL